MQLNFKNKTLDLSVPKVMGILNITPDSFFDGNKHNSEEKIIAQVEKMIADGASIIDVGGYSTRPNAEHVSIETEINRIIPVIKNIKQHFKDCIISVDTFRSEVAEKAIESGADMINDVFGGTYDPKILEVAGKHKTPYILMHIKGTPQNMQDNPQYENVVTELMQYFTTQINLARKHGVEQIIIDIGFGFGKTIEHNYTLLNHLTEFQSLGYPLLIGASRKSMINKLLNIAPADALNGTTVVNSIALYNGANLLRVHDVKEAVEAIKIVSFANNNK